MRNGRPDRAPAAREVADWQAAEQNAVAWLRWLGHPDARATGAGADGGVDVRGSGAFAQVKWQGKAVDRAALQRLYGARARQPGTLYFFCNAGFSKPASEYAESVGMATFSYSPATGLITPVSTAARSGFDASAGRQQAGTGRRQPTTGTAQPNARRPHPTVRPPSAAPAPGSFADQMLRAAGGLGNSQQTGRNAKPAPGPGPAAQPSWRGFAQRPGGHDDTDRDIIDVEPVSILSGTVVDPPKAATPQPRTAGRAQAIIGLGVSFLLVIIDEKTNDGETPTWYAMIAVIAFLIGISGLVRLRAGRRSA